MSLENKKKFESEEIFLLEAINNNNDIIGINNIALFYLKNKIDLMDENFVINIDEDKYRKHRIKAYSIFPRPIRRWSVKCCYMDK